MKNYKISSKSYTSMSVPVGESKTLAIPKKGGFVTAQFKEIPQGLLILQKNKVITIEEI